MTIVGHLDDYFFVIAASRMEKNVLMPSQCSNNYTNCSIGVLSATSKAVNSRINQKYSKTLNNDCRNRAFNCLKIQKNNYIIKFCDTL